MQTAVQRRQEACGATQGYDKPTILLLGAMHLDLASRAQLYSTFDPNVHDEKRSINSKVGGGCVMGGVVCDYIRNKTRQQQKMGKLQE